VLPIACAAHPYRLVASELGRRAKSNHSKPRSRASLGISPGIQRVIAGAVSIGGDNGRAICRGFSAILKSAVLARHSGIFLGRGIEGHVYSGMGLAGVVAKIRGWALIVEYRLRAVAHMGRRPACDWFRRPTASVDGAVPSVNLYHRRDIGGGCRS